MIDIKRMWRLGLMILVLFLWPVVAQAQVVGGEVLGIGLESVGREASGMNTGKWGWYREGQWIPVHVRLTNKTGHPWTGYLAADQVDMDGDQVRSVGQKFVLPESMDGRDLWFYVWPRPNHATYPITSILVLDESHQIVASLPVEGTPQTVRSTHNVDYHSERWVVLIGPKQLGWEHYFNAKGGVASNRVSQLQTARDIPDQALGFDGVDLVVWEASQENVKPGDLGYDLRIKALLGWVRSGGHLIITGSNPAELMENKQLAEALPMDLQATRDVPLLKVMNNFIRSLLWSNNQAGIQMIGRLKPRNNSGTGSGGGLIVPGNISSAENENPLVVTGTYGRGAITLVTVDLCDKSLNLGASQWLSFWQHTAGWSGPYHNAPNILTVDDYNRLTKDKDPSISDHPTFINLDMGLLPRIELLKQSTLLLLLAIIFLGVYWIGSCPVADILLRRSKHASWTWWIFGASVVTASFLAVVVVSIFRLTNREVRHSTYVSSSVVDLDHTPIPSGDEEVSVSAIYGVFVPSDHKVTIKLAPPKSETQATPHSEVEYLVPLSKPDDNDIHGFADQKSYELNADDMTSVSVPFRSTLKKFQARWSGKGFARIEGAKVQVSWQRSEDTDLENAGEMQKKKHKAVGIHAVLSGQLVNHTGYDLNQVCIAVYAGNQGRQNPAGLFTIGNWKNGATLDLAKYDVEPDSLDMVLIQNFQSDSNIGHGFGGIITQTKRPDGYLLLRSLLEFKGGESWSGINNRTEYERHFSRLMDRSVAFRAGRLLVMAHAGSGEIKLTEEEKQKQMNSTPYAPYGNDRENEPVDFQEGVPAPLPLLVDGALDRGRGDISFTWVMNLP